MSRRCMRFRRRPSRPALRTLICLKLVILVGVLSAYYLPQAEAILASAVSNLLWLFKDRSLS